MWRLTVQIKAFGIFRVGQVPFGLGVALVLVAAACSSSSSSDNSGDGSNADQDAGDQTDVDASTGSDAKATVTTRMGDVCTDTGKCSTGQECMTISQKGGVAICLNTCSGKNKCPNDEECSDNGICIPTCSEGCPSAMECITDIDQCIFDCNHYSKLCGPGEACIDGESCGPPVVDAGPPPKVECEPGGGTATSGVTGSKTVGSLTSTEQATFCDWTAAVTGGYGCDGECDGGLDVTFSATQAECIAKFTKAGCAATVSEAEACVKTNAQNVCSLAIATAEDCATLRACM